MSVEWEFMFLCVGEGSFSLKFIVFSWVVDSEGDMLERIFFVKGLV